MIVQSERERPYPYLKKALVELGNIILHPIIVEIGSMRAPCSHDLETESCELCNDGHSTLVFAKSGHEIYTVDASVGSYEICKELSKTYPNVMPFREDGIKFLKEFHDEIDLLFLDGWDLCLPLSAENHVLAYQAAKDKFTDQTLVLVDDTDIDYIDGEYFPAKGVGGKAALLAKELEADGWQMKFSGRQTMWAKA